jgi:hypothetical protein
MADGGLDVGMYRSPAPVNPLGVLHEYATTQNQLNQARTFQMEFAARQALGPMMKMSIRPDGTLDQAKLFQLVAAHPATGWKLPELVEGLLKNQLTTEQIAKTHLENAKGHFGNMVDVGTGILAKARKEGRDWISPDEYVGGMQRGIAMGLYKPTDLMALLKNNPDIVGAGPAPAPGSPEELARNKRIYNQVYGMVNSSHQANETVKTTLGMSPMTEAERSKWAAEPMQVWSPEKGAMINVPRGTIMPTPGSGFDTPTMPGAPGVPAPPPTGGPLPGGPTPAPAGGPLPGGPTPVAMPAVPPSGTPPPSGPAPPPGAPGTPGTPGGPGGPGAMAPGAGAVPGWAPAGPSDIEKGKMEALTKYNEGLDQRAKKAIDVQQVVKELRETMSHVKGGAGTSFYMTAAKLLQGIGVSNDIVDKIAGGNLAGLQEADKLYLQNAVGVLRQQLLSTAGEGSAGRLALAEFNAYLKANPNVDMDPRATKRMLDFTEMLAKGTLYEQQKFNEALEKHGPGRKMWNWQAFWNKELTTNPKLRHFMELPPWEEKGGK